MAIALGQPVDEITHGLQIMKIDGHVMASERVPEAQLAPPADVHSVQALPLPLEGHENPGGDVVVRMNPPEASCVGQSMLYPSMEAAHPCVDFSDVDQFSISGAPKFLPHFQGPVYTGYPAPVVNVPGYMPFSAEGLLFPNPVVEYNPVYNQNFYCSAPCTLGQFNYGFGQPYAYPQYQVVPSEQCNMPGPIPQSEGMMIPEGSFIPFGFQQMNADFGSGQLLSTAMAGPLPVCNNLQGYVSMPFPVVSNPHALSAASPAWVQPPLSAKGLHEESKHAQPKSGLQQSKGGTWNVSKYSAEKVDNRVPVVDAKKQSKRQHSPGPIYGVQMPIKGAWVRAGQLPCGNPAHILKPLGGHNKGPCTCPLSAEQFNLTTFSTEFEDAKHFIIKSFSDENVYRSVQHGVWASTPHGNKKLDEAYRDAQRRAAGKVKGCPVFLYFSVNGSGRFCGVAEMIGPVDFNNTMDFWERNRWCGSFPVKWHFIKDVPHCQLRRIILQNNENKPVTSSRDTQEVSFEQGLLMLNIIKNYSTTASILDNFPVFSGPPKSVANTNIEQQPNESSVESNVGSEGTVSVVSETDNALKACNGEAKARENLVQGKPNQGKAEPMTQDVSGEVGGRKLDKENVRVPESA